MRDSIMKTWVVVLAVALAASLALLPACSGFDFRSLSDETQSSMRSSTASSAHAQILSSSSSNSAKSSGEPNRTQQFDWTSVPAYSGVPSVEVNGGVPFFEDGDLTRGSFEDYAPLDALGRCGVAFALVGEETMPDEERGSIGMIQPSGWHTVRYDWVDGQYLFNRCHLIGYQLTGENANERNLITGTRSMNVQGMLPYENRVASYVESTGNHVLYRSTPVFDGGDLVARGVLLEACSIEDAGQGVSFCAWCYNVEPGVEIDYATGESAAAETTASESEPIEDVTYILNKRSMIFHYPYCSSVEDMADHNKQNFYGNREEAISDGYKPCGRCNP